MLKILVQKRDSGEIRTLDEFKDRLKVLTNQLLANQIKPTLTLLEAVPGEDTSSERYNELLERIQDDLETAFTEADNLEEVMAAHHNLIDHVSLKALRFGINELDSRITLYEFLSNNGLGFNHALFNTFAESEKFSITRTDKDAAVVFSDFRTGQYIDTDEDALIDLIGERLSLGFADNAYAFVQQVEWLANTNSLRSERNVAFENSDINNVIDGQNNTYWIEPILVSAVRPGGVSVEVALEISSPSDLNFIDIEPATRFPLTLSLIDYVDGNGARQTLSAPDLDLSGPVRLNFSRIATKTLILRFIQKNYTEIQFIPKIGSSNFHRAVLGEDHLGVDMASVSDDLKQALSSDYIMREVMNVEDNTNEMVRYFEYIVGFDNLRPGFSRYQDRSVFVSVKQTVDQPGQFALKVDERRPVQLAGSSSIESVEHQYSTATATGLDDFYHGAVEYWLTVKSYADDGMALATNTVPILPLGASRVYHERLLLTHKSSIALTYNNRGPLRFFCDESAYHPNPDVLDPIQTISADGVVVYRNGTQLEYGVDWSFVDEQLDGSTRVLTETSPDAGIRMSRGIQIDALVRPLDIYTVSYTPKVSNTRVLPIEPDVDTELFNIVDLTGDQALRMFQDAVILVDRYKSGIEVVSADIYLTIIIRRNSAVESFTPFVEEFMLLTASRDSSRFEGVL
jgi:hypothetical protein